MFKRKRIGYYLLQNKFKIQSEKPNIGIALKLFFGYNILKIQRGC
jgi:hypothetical protein